ncbi:MAG TPA: response regulator transcription factor [Sandaracinaceae bacterium LLY-WYZ-13_1]|nr:response regulator transcription factor [Sandaracinaceae bacterium LLY-WYZ-13_1]
MIRVLIADDHPVVLDGLSRLFEQAGGFEVVAAVSSLDDVRSAVESSRPAVAVLDLNMPKMRGVETLEELSRTYGFPAIVVFTMQEEDQLAVSALQAGAKAFLSKTRPPEDLLEAVRRAARGERFVTDDVAARLLGSHGPSAAHDRLSERERQVFELLVRGESAKAVARALDLSPSTVHTYTERIKAKLGADTVADLVRYAFRHGLTA